ncbi:MAG: prephenate dehydrogenase [Solirubrobacteraceae bacterium]|nr:prephenate dehydrogenase [Solirubrobacteraceae bacterium]
MNVAVIGVGVIGGSVGLAARRRLGATVRGVDPRADEALAAGAIDEASADLASALHGADAAVVAVPLAALPGMVAAVLDAAPAGCLVTDVGSTKRAVVAANGDERFVGGHPLAGSESAGVAHAREDLFDGAVWYLTPTSTTSGVALERLHRFVTGLGARPAAIDAETHDRVMAAVSHLPHVVANVLVAQAARALGGEQLPPTGPSFRDATRVAGANPALWPDIYLANQDALLAAVDDTLQRLTAAREALAGGDRERLAAWQADAAGDRAALLEAGVTGGAASELRAVVPNRPGVIADIALGLGREGINISDMALTPSADNTRGEIALWVGERDAPRARDMLTGLGFAVSEPSAPGPGAHDDRQGPHPA